MREENSQSKNQLISVYRKINDHYEKVKNNFKSYQNCNDQLSIKIVDRKKSKNKTSIDLFGNKVSIEMKYQLKKT